MRAVTYSALVTLLVGATAFAEDPPASVPLIKIGGAARGTTPAVETTHSQVKEIAVKGDVSGNTLQTLCLGGDGNVVALVAPGRYGTAPKAAASEVQVFAPDGEQVRKWKVNFLAQSINAGPDGSVFVAGDGHIAKYDKTGKLVADAELPHIAQLLKDTDALRKQAKAQLQEEVQSYEEMVKQFTDQKEQLVKKDTDGKITQAEKQQLKALDQNIKIYEQMAKQQKERTVDDVVRDLSGRLRIISALAVTEKDLYVVTGESKGYGYAVWRMGHDFTDAKHVLGGLRGCCGQMDVQARGDELFVAENCSHAVGKYTRDGKKLGSFGKRGQETDPTCFGGCCNPMNLRLTADGKVYTAESEGHVKLFTPAGEFAGCVGTATLKGGCKNVAPAVSADGERVFFCDQPGSRIIVLAKKAAKAAE